ncbi:hypothetical protein KUCAC02_007456, partial [Chaenocephalus aceratus]
VHSCRPCSQDPDCLGEKPGRERKDGKVTAYERVVQLSLLLLGGLKKLQMQVFDQLAGTTGNGLETLGLSSSGVKVGWISIQSSTEPVIQPAQFGPESNQSSHLVTNQGPGCDVTATELWVPWEQGGVNTMNHIRPLCW